MMMDDERMAHTFSAVCSPPISMMFKGRGRSSSKLKKMEIVTQDEELDEEVCDGLLKISKSSEELWKDVYAVFSPPTPIGSKMPDYMPFDSYKHPSSISTTPPRTTALGVDSEANSSQITALDILSNDTGKTSVIPAIQYYPPNYTPPVLNNKYTTTPGTTVTNSIPIQHPQISNTKVQTIKEEDDTNSNSNTTQNNPVVNLKRSKRNSRSLEQPSYSTAKRPPARSASAANINNIINESVEAGETREDGSPRVPRARRHNSADNTIHNNINQQVPLSNFNPQSHTQPQTQLENINDRSHNLFDNRANPNPSMNSIPHLHMNMLNNAVYTGNTPMLDINEQHASNSNTSNQVNYNHVSSLSHDTPNTNHVQYTNNTSNTPNSILNMGNALSNNDKYWTEVIFSCKKLVALAGAGLANTLSFAELVDGLTLARHITSTTAAAVMNSGGYTPLQSAPVSDEFNRLVTETFGTLGLPQSNPNQNLFHNQNNTFNPTFNTHPSHTNQQNQPSLHINTNIDNNQNNMFPFFSSPPLNGLPSSPPLYSASSPTYSPSTYPAAPFSHSAPSTPISSSSSNGISSPGVGSPLSLSTPTWSSGSGAFVFEELRKKLPVPSSITTKEEDSDESPVDSPSLSPKSPPLSGLSLIPLSPCLSPGGSSTSSPPVPPEVSIKAEREREAREGRTKEREEKTSWKKPRGKKKRPKYEADLECRSCGVRQTPEWRRGPFGAKTLCNACGLHWAKVLKAEGKGDQKRVALLEAKRSQFMMTQKRAHGTRSAAAAAAASGSSSPTSTIKNEPLYLSPHMSH